MRCVYPWEYNRWIKSPYPSQTRRTCNWAEIVLQKMNILERMKLTKLGVTSTQEGYRIIRTGGSHPVSALCADLDSMSATPSVCGASSPSWSDKEQHPSTNQSFLFFSRWFLVVRGCCFYILLLFGCFTPLLTCSDGDVAPGWGKGGWIKGHPATPCFHHMTS